MAWSDNDNGGSRIFRSLLLDGLGGAGIDLGGTAMDVALFGSSATPDLDAATGDAMFGVDQWVTGNEITDANGWPSGGLPMQNITWGADNGMAGAVMLDADDVVSAEGTSLSGVEGDLVYLADGRGVVYHSFGGPQAVTNGTFSIRWADAGVMRVEL